MAQKSRSWARLAGGLFGAVLSTRFGWFEIIFRPDGVDAPVSRCRHRGARQLIIPLGSDGSKPDRSSYADQIVRARWLGATPNDLGQCRG